MKNFPVIPDPFAAPDADSVPSESIADLVPDPAKTAELRPAVLDAMKTVFDPEIPVNIYELGLIYDVLVDADANVGIRMTLTAPACPAAQSLPVEVREKVQRVPGVRSARVEIVWEPPWTKDRMSEAAKLQLGLW
ncbi:MAG TPA: SUF system Fe-S cluster assembly protein [Vicinamibacterales bacterium]|nr:SUF system Fe-S cluster assembly protein [Vicinamibacterales bacterium]